MISPEMEQMFDDSIAHRRMYYGKLRNVRTRMIDLLFILEASATSSRPYIDLGIRDRQGEFWIPLTRPSMPDPRPDFPRRDLMLTEFLEEWAIGVKLHAEGDMQQMNLRYPELASLRGSRLMPEDMIYRSERPANWLKRAYKWILRS